MPAKYVLRKGSTGKFRFNLLASNGQVIATSEAYETKARAMAGIASVRKNAADAVVVDETAPAAKAAPAKATKAAKPAKPAAAVKAAKATRAAVASKATPAKKAAKKATKG